MKTMNSLPSIPPHEMREHMKAMAEVDKKLGLSGDDQPGDIIAQLAPQEEAVVEESPQEEQQTQSNEQAKHFNALREKVDRTERERDELMSKLREMEYERMRQQQALPQQATYEDTDMSIAPDAIAEGKHISHLTKKLRQMEEQIKKNQLQASQNIMEAQLRAQHPDFDTIVSKNNVEELRRSYPALAQALAAAATSDPYSAAASAYTIIKEMGIARSAQETQMTKNLIQANATKPRSAQAASPQRGNTPLSKVNDFINDGKMTPEYQDQLLKEMNLARRSSR
jgi:hypothetical protein